MEEQAYCKDTAIISYSIQNSEQAAIFLSNTAVHFHSGNKSHQFISGGWNSKIKIPYIENINTFRTKPAIVGLFILKNYLCFINPETTILWYDCIVGNYVFFEACLFLRYSKSQVIEILHLFAPIVVNLLLAHASRLLGLSFGNTGEYSQDKMNNSCLMCM